MLDYLSGANDFSRRILEGLYNSGAAPGYFGRSTANYLSGREGGNTAQRSQEVAARGVAESPHVNQDQAYGMPDNNLPRPPAVAERPTSTPRPPVATPATPQADSSRNPADAAADTMRSLQDATSGDQPAREGRDANERLANFGFAMAASRNPSLFGMIGEAGLALQRGNREDRQDSRQEREVDVMAEYRQAQIQLAQAEQEWQRDPNNPLNVARLAEARYRVAAAANVGRSGGGSGGSRITGQIVGDDGILYGTTRDGQVVPYRTGEGTPFRRGETERFQAQWNSMRNAALERMSQITAPERTLSPEERERRANAEATRGVAALRESIRRPGTAAPSTPAPTEPATQGAAPTRLQWRPPA